MNGTTTIEVDHHEIIKTFDAALDTAARCFAVVTVGAVVGLCGGGFSGVIPTVAISCATALAIKVLDNIRNGYDRNPLSASASRIGHLFSSLKGIAMLTGLAVAQLTVGLFGTMTFYVLTGSTVCWVLLNGLCSIEI